MRRLQFKFINVPHLSSNKLTSPVYLYCGHVIGEFDVVDFELLLLSMYTQKNHRLLCIRLQAIWPLKGVPEVTFCKSEVAVLYSK